MHSGEVDERFKSHAWKACEGSNPPRVRIPPSPPEIAKKTGPSGPFFSFASLQRHKWQQKMMQRNSWDAFSPYTSRSFVLFGLPLEFPDEVSLSHHHH